MSDPLPFHKLSPCLYQGEVLCSECTYEEKDECDMKAGRELHLHYFRAGMRYQNHLAEIILEA